MRMNAAAWVCLLSPLAATLALALAGTRLSRRGAGYVSTLSTMVSFAAAIVALVIMLGESPDARAHVDDLVDVALGRAVQLRPHAAHRPAERDDDADRRRRRLADRRLLGRLHGGRGRGAPLLRVHVAVRLLDAPARPGGQPAPAARRLGHGRPLELPADRLLPGAPLGDRGRQEGVHHERVRRRDDGARPLPADPAHRAARLRRRLRRRAARRHGREPDRARPARRRGREVGADPAPHLASRRDGGPDPGQRPDPRRHDGHRGRLPDRPHATRCSSTRRRSRISPPGSAR